MSSSEREVEHKLRVHGLYRLPELTSATATSGPTITLTATYYDTATLRLARSGITLRRRTGGADAGWHLKLPSGQPPSTTALVRDELHLPLESSPIGVPPAEFLGLVLGFSRGGAIEEVATLRTERTPHELLAADGRLLAELVDDSVSVLDGPLVVARFRELEVEVRDGTSAEVGSVVTELVAAGAIAGGLTSKVARALGPAAAAPPDIPWPKPVGPKDPAADALGAYLARYVQAFVTQDLRVRRELPDSVHQLRVAARRLRSGLTVFKPLVDPAWANALRVELGWIANELGAVRDREVLEDRLLRDLAALPVDQTDPRDVAAAVSVVRRAFDDERAHALAGVQTAMAADRYVTLLNALVDGARNPRVTPKAAGSCKTVLPPLVAKAWASLAADVRSLDPLGADDDWHEARITAKRVRYATDALVPVFGEPAKDFSRELELVTEALGEHHDAAIAAETTRRLAAGRRVTGTTGFVLGLLHEYERSAVLAARSDFLQTWPSVSHRRHRAWLSKG